MCHSEKLSEEASSTSLPVLWWRSFHELRDTWLWWIMSSTNGRSTATMMCWMKRTTNATFGTDRKELVLVALLQRHGRCIFVSASRKSDRSFIGVFSVSHQFFRYLSNPSDNGQMCWELDQVFLYLSYSSDENRQVKSFCATSSIWIHFASVRSVLFCESRNFKIFLKAIVNSFQFLFETSPPRIMGHEMLFLCISFAVPSTTRSPLLDDVVLDWESIQSPLVKKLAGFTFFEEMSTSALDNSLIPIKKAFWALHVENCFAKLK